MQYRRDQRAGKDLSVLGFGCMRLPRGVAGIDMARSERIILRAVDAGVNYFDTAYIYPGSEAALGRILHQNGARDRVNIATKMPIGSCRAVGDFERIFEKQLENLRTGHIEYYLMHNITTLAQWQALCALGVEDWLRARQAQGRIGQVGFSFHGTRDAFLQVLDAYDWDFCQIQYNYSDEHYQAGRTGLRRAAERGLPVVIMEPLLGGKLAGRLPKAAQARLSAVRPGLTPAAWGLRWLLDQKEPTVILSGMNDDAQLADNLRTVQDAAPGLLTDGERAAYADVRRMFQQAWRVPCTGCGYCMPCPNGVNIPGCFAAYNASHAMGFMVGMTQYTTALNVTSANHQMAGRCTGCGQCEAHCPQHIAIARALAGVRRRMEPLYFRAGVRVLRGFRGRK